MARKYRKVEVALWGDARFRRLSSAPPNAQDLFIALLIGKHTLPIPGVVPATPEELAASMRWTEAFGAGFDEAFRKAFDEVCAEGLAEVDPEGLIYLPRALLDGKGRPRESNKPESPNVLRGWGKCWDDVPECGLKDKIYRDLESFAKALGASFAKAFGEAFEEPCGHPSPNQEQEQEQEQKEKITLSRPLAESGSGAREGTRESKPPPEPERRSQRPRPKRSLPERAWKLADYLRRHLLRWKPDHAIGKGATSEAKWDTSPTRRSWAQAAELMLRDARGGDGRDLDRTLEIIRWLFGENQQRESGRFRVESMASLRKKWDALDDASRPRRVNGEPQRKSFDELYEGYEVHS